MSAIEFRPNPDYVPYTEEIRMRMLRLGGAIIGSGLSSFYFSSLSKQAATLQAKADMSSQSTGDQFRSKTFEMLAGLRHERTGGEAGLAFQWNRQFNRPVIPTPNPVLKHAIRLIKAAVEGDSGINFYDHVQMVQFEPTTGKLLPYSEILVGHTDNNRNLVASAIVPPSLTTPLTDTFELQKEIGWWPH